MFIIQHSDSFEINLFLDTELQKFRTPHFGNLNFKQ